MTDVSCQLLQKDPPCAGFSITTGNGNPLVKILHAVPAHFLSEGLKTHAYHVKTLFDSESNMTAIWKVILCAKITTFPMKVIRNLWQLWRQIFPTAV